MAKVTAIVSAYYAEKYLDGRLDNLEAQEPKPEIIVVCQEGGYEHKIARTHEAHVITTEAVPTIYQAWNMAIEQAGSDYITSANSDDRLYPGALAELAQALESKPMISVVYSWVDIVDQIGGDPLGRFTWAEGGLDKLLQGCFIGPMPMWRKSLHGDMGYFDDSLRVAGDYDYWLRLAKAGKKFNCIRKSLGAYLRRPDSAEHRAELLTTWETAKVRARYRSNK